MYVLAFSDGVGRRWTQTTKLNRSSAAVRACVVADSGQEKLGWTKTNMATPSTQANCPESTTISARDTGCKTARVVHDSTIDFALGTQRPSLSFAMTAAREKEQATP